jgi:hypothetical protein
MTAAVGDQASIDPGDAVFDDRLPFELPPGNGWRWAAFALGGFALVALLAWLVAAWSVAHPPASPPHEVAIPGVEALPSWVRGWSHWDAGWYDRISRDGYTYHASEQSSVAFFPLYPLLVHLAGYVVPGWSTFARGATLTAVFGLVAAGLFFAWCRTRMSPPAATTAVLLLAVYPYSIYLFGAVYADALLLACALAAFVLLERGHVAWATIAAVACSAARPVGVLIVVAVAVRHCELRSAVDAGGRWGKRASSVLIGAVGASGFGLYSLYLWWRFGDPFAFATTQQAPGWDQGPGLHTWLKVGFFEELGRSPFSSAALGLVLQASVALLMLATAPAVARRFGHAYGLLVALVVLLPLVASKDFQGTGRYVLPAFPVFALLGDCLDRHPAARVVVLGAGLVAVLLFASWFAKGNYLA